MINPYHYCDRSSIHEGVDFSDPTILGLEIEIDIPDNTEDVAEAAISFGPILSEEDGSLDDTGVEFIFAPLPLAQITPESYIGQWSKFINPLSKAWKQDGYGMHINVNANPMTNLHAGKFCYFFNANKEFSVKLAGRDIGNFCEDVVRHRRDKTYHTPEDFARPDWYYGPAMRRSRSRIEVRMFQSSTNFRRIRQNCELVDAVRCFTEQAPVEQLIPDAFISWLMGYTEKYAVLAERLLTSTVT